MNKKSTLFAGLLFSCFQAFSQVPSGDEAAAFPMAEQVRIDQVTHSLQYLRFKPGFSITKAEFPKWLRETLHQPETTEWRELETSSDELGFQHFRFQQYHNNLLVEGQIFIAHVRNGKVESCNGESKLLKVPAPQVSLGTTEAFHQALQIVGAEQYMWQIPAEEQLLKNITNNSKATYYPNAELVYAPANGNFETDEYIPAYKLNIYAAQPVKRENLYISATDGHLLFSENLLHDADVTATAATKYNGKKRIHTTLSNGTYKLESSSLGITIRTLNVQRTTNYAGAVDFTNADTLWNNTNPFKDEVATDAHWGAERTYLYYKGKFNRNSYNNYGSAMLNYVHYDKNFNNAYWDGMRMTYGDGDGSFMRPLVSIDIVGHELTHGVTGNTARLVYKNESGALNESFSDIFGTAIDFQNSGANANFLIGEQVVVGGGALRSMENPNLYGDPDTYTGKNWKPANGPDNGGVHSNSGVQNFWFYLLVNGGQGVNDLGNAYKVNGIGMDKAERIAYRTLTTYLTSTATFADAAAMSVAAATDLYSACSPEVVAVADAWYAVGVGQPYRLAAAFNADNSYFCSFPATVQFKNTSVKASSYTWDFGDGQTSTSSAPSHTYTAPGTYTVKLKANTGTAICGATADSLIRTAYITVANNTSLTATTCTLPTTATPQANMGIQKMTFATIDKTSGDALEGNQDFSCNQRANLIAGNLYEMTLLTGATPKQRARAWIDYNNDGTFDPATEQVVDLAPFETSATAVVRTSPQPVLNTPLRMRVAADLTANIDIQPCQQLLRGQYEDYSVVFTQKIAKPAADFKASQTSIPVGYGINFTDLTNFQPTSWEWSFPDGTPSSSTLQNPTGISYPKDGIYTVQLIVHNAQGTDTLTKSAYIRVGNGGAVTGLSKEQLTAKLQVYPNPASETVNVRYAFEGKKPVTVMLVNALGQEVRRSTISADSNFETSLNVQQVAPGLYFLRLSDGENLIVKKLLVQRQ